MAPFTSCILYYIVLIASNVLAGIYLPKRDYHFKIPPTISPGGHIGTIYTLQNSIVPCSHSQNTTVSVQPHSIATADLKVSALLSKGRVLLTAEDVPDTATTINHFRLLLNCTDERAASGFIYSNLLWESNIIVEILSTTGLTPGSLDSKWLSENLCHNYTSLVYGVVENSDPGRLDTFEGYPHLSAKFLRGYEVRISFPINKSSQILAIDTSTSSFNFKSSLDREASPEPYVREYVECHIFFQGKELSFSPVRRDVIINVYDVDDNPPKKTRPLKNVDTINMDEETTDLLLHTIDLDSTNVTNVKSYHVTSNDTHNVIQLHTTYKQTSKRGKAPSSSIKTRVQRILDFKSIPLPYKVHVTVEDTTYLSTDPGTNNKVIYKLLFENTSAPPPVQNSNVKEDLNMAAAKYTLITKLGKPRPFVSETTKFEWKVVHVTPPMFKNVVDVTKDGHVFVLDDQGLYSYQGIVSPFVKIVLLANGERVEEFGLTLKLITNVYGRRKDKTCNGGCSRYVSVDSCTSACGYGSPSGQCFWNATTASCTPDPNTCPDRICSILEKMNSDICPQDCNQDVVDSVPSTRTTSDNNTSCTCVDGNLIDNPACKCTTVKPSPGGSIDMQNGNGTLKQKTSPSAGCSTECQAGVSIAVIVFVIILAIMVKQIVGKCRDQRQIPTLKHVNSLVSMSAIPSDYVVDDLRETRVHATRQTLSPASGPWMTKSNGGSGNRESHEDEWEFPRHNLSLEHIIGEGEFGQVMKAQAKMEDQGQGSESTKVVAVKMLKPEASGAEYQDLFSEFQMLKEVNHPNVIQLLGVCTQKGPLYIIVEYCELGSLRSFLRASKYKNKGSWEEKQRNGSFSNDKLEARTLTSRDLFSFAWQIAKGMDYLSGLKIVHRDLAARNVLVKEGMQIKISDFGLSRDVYEANTYLKMSKGRIPVKWMAPESLYAQIYTTKSDTWSYGIVLWEIITLGASPYPGIPPERLFNLLSTGYRMDRPEDCPDEMYALMQKCWKSATEDRPSFAVLKEILDHILQQNTDYLELPDSANGGPFDEFSSLRKPGKKESSRQMLRPSTSSDKLINQPTYRNIRQAPNGQSFDQEQSAMPSVSPIPSSQPFTTQASNSSSPWNVVDDESDRESVPESSNLLSGNKTISKNLYENNANVVRPSNNINNNNNNNHVTSEHRKSPPNICLFPRRGVHENLTYV